MKDDIIRSSLNLFNGVITINDKPLSSFSQSLKDNINFTLQYGYILDSKIPFNLQIQIQRVISLTPSFRDWNKTFYNDWERLKEMSDYEYYFNQILHYISTYGMPDSDWIYLSRKDFEFLNEDFKIKVIKAYTPDQIKNKIHNILNSGIALKKETIQDIINILDYIGVDESSIAYCKNREVASILMKELNIIPHDPINFLRILAGSLLIKNKEKIEEIKSLDYREVMRLWNLYFEKYGNDGYKFLSSIFYRFKPLFLALRHFDFLKSDINKIRRYAKKYHKPLKENFLDHFMIHLSEPDFDFKRLETEIEKINIFRKIRIYNGLDVRNNVDSVIYPIRNGKSFTKIREPIFHNKYHVFKALSIIGDSIFNDLKHLKGKKVYMPINYLLPTSEKQFIGNFPKGTMFSTNKNLLIGVYWKNYNQRTVDLDFSLISLGGKKIGWDGSKEFNSIYFSGDITDAPEGASEFFFFNNINYDESYLLKLNFYNQNNFNDDEEIEFYIVVGERDNIPKSNTINPSEFIYTVKSKISKKNLTIGLVDINDDETRFYLDNFAVRKNPTSSFSDITIHQINYLTFYYDLAFSFKHVFDYYCEYVDSPEEADIDLSPDKIEKDTLINLLTSKE